MMSMKVITTSQISAMPSPFRAEQVYAFGAQPSTTGRR